MGNQSSNRKRVMDDDDDFSTQIHPNDGRNPSLFKEPTLMQPLPGHGAYVQQQDNRSIAQPRPNLFQQHQNLVHQQQQKAMHQQQLLQQQLQQQQQQNAVSSQQAYTNLVQSNDAMET